MARAWTNRRPCIPGRARFPPARQRPGPGRHVPRSPTVLLTTTLYTFGAPRVGTKRYINNVDVDLTRWVNNNDIVPRVPPTWLGYRHTGVRFYINTYGKIRRMTKRQRTKDRWRGFLHGLKEGKIDHFSDHSIARYVDHIADAVEEATTSRGA